MNSLTNAELARLYHRRLKLPPGIYTAPCATVTWDGRLLQLQSTGVPLDEETAAQWPDFARHIAPPVFTPEPTIAALLADYPAATANLPGVLSPESFTARLTTCRACELWNETARNGQGSCASIHAPCACRRLWMTPETCPESKWP